MKRTMTFAVVALLTTAGTAVADQPVVLTDAELDLVSAGAHRGGVNDITLKRGVTSAPTWTPDTGDEVIVGFEQADPGQIIHLTVATPGTERSSHDRYANIEVSYLLQR